MFRLDRQRAETDRWKAYAKIYAKEKEQPMDRAQQRARPTAGKAWFDDRCGQSRAPGDGSAELQN